MYSLYGLVSQRNVSFMANNIEKYSNLKKRNNLGVQGLKWLLGLPVPMIRPTCWEYPNMHFEIHFWNTPRTINNVGMRFIIIPQIRVQIVCHHTCPEFSGELSVWGAFWPQHLSAMLVGSTLGHPTLPSGVKCSPRSPPGGHRPTLCCGQGIAHHSYLAPVQWTTRHSAFSPHPCNHCDRSDTGIRMVGP